MGKLTWVKLVKWAHYKVWTYANRVQPHVIYCSGLLDKGGIQQQPQHLKTSSRWHASLAAWTQSMGIEGQKAECMKPHVRAIFLEALFAISIVQSTLSITVSQRQRPLILELQRVSREARGRQQAESLLTQGEKEAESAWVEPSLSSGRSTQWHPHLAQSNHATKAAGRANIVKAQHWMSWASLC